MIARCHTNHDDIHRLSRSGYDAELWENILTRHLSLVPLTTKAYAWLTTNRYRNRIQGDWTDEETQIKSMNTVIEILVYLRYWDLTTRMGIREAGSFIAFSLSFMTRIWNVLWSWCEQIMLKTTRNPNSANIYYWHKVKRKLKIWYKFSRKLKQANVFCFFRTQE